MYCLVWTMSAEKCVKEAIKNLRKKLLKFKSANHPTPQHHYQQTINQY